MDWPEGVEMPEAVAEAMAFDFTDFTYCTIDEAIALETTYRAAIEALVELWRTDRASLGTALDELTIPATRYYLGRTSISTSRFPRYLRSVWDDLHAKDRAVLLYDIGHWLEETPTGTYGRDWWLEFMEEVEAS